jgi:hypothetical protein
MRFGPPVPLQCVVAMRALMVVWAATAATGCVARSPIGMRCNSPEECPVGTECANIYGASQCVADCTNIGQPCAQGRCIAGFCWAPGAGALGAFCSQPAVTYSVGCVDGAACSLVAHLPGTAGTCMSTCVPSLHDDSQCGSGHVCTADGVCMPPCDPTDRLACADQYRCVQGECRQELLCSLADHSIVLCPAMNTCDQNAQACVGVVTYDQTHPRVP